MQHERIFFTLRPGGTVFHCNVLNNAPQCQYRGVR